MAPIVPPPARARLLRAIAIVCLVTIGPAVGGCVPRADSGSLGPTLELVDVPGGRIAVQAGMPVPTFERQPRPRVDLGGLWRVEPTTFDAELTLTDREAALGLIEAGGGGRHLPDFDVSGWEVAEVPGALNPPPDRHELGGWFRREFRVPAMWRDRSWILKFGAVNYVADVWLNGVHLGYHEGGYTPFAFDTAPGLRAGDWNTLVVRVDNPGWGTRNDILPWGLADWWNYGGITGPVWLEGLAAVHAARADVVPHLDGADVSVVVSRTPGDPDAEPRAADVGVRIEILPALVDASNVLDDDPRALIAPPSGDPAAAAGSIVAERLETRLAAGESRVVRASFLFDEPDLWSPASPALYVLRVVVDREGIVADEIFDTFGLRQVAVDPVAPRVLLNGELFTFAGANLHDERIVTIPGERAGRTGHRVIEAGEARAQLDRIRDLGGNLVRTGHTPANPLVLRLADRLGLAVWEEIPLYHFTPLTFEIAIRRGIAQQMLREMALRDMNRPAVMFHGLANESTGDEGRLEALTTLHDVDREIDGTRLTGQAAYGFRPDDPTQAPLDVAGFTFYYGVFYGADAATGTAAALEAAHAAYPDKPILALEFGRWSDPPDGEQRQVDVFRDTTAPLVQRISSRPEGYVAGLVWWSLDDYFTMRPQIDIEHFGLYRQDGTRRPVATLAESRFGQVATGRGSGPPVASGGVARAIEPAGGRDFVAFAIYGAAVVITVLGAILAVLARRGGRSRAAAARPPGDRPGYHLRRGPWRRRPARPGPPPAPAVGEGGP